MTRAAPKNKDDKDDRTKPLPAVAGMTRYDKTRLHDVVIPEYCDFLKRGKIAEHVVDLCRDMLCANGFIKYQDGMQMPGKAKGLYLEDKDGLQFCAIKLSKESIENGFNLICAHNDAPCLETKPHPVKTTIDGIVLDTNYYGGIVTHQYLARKYNIVGTVIKKDGSEIDVSLRGYLIDPAPHISKGKTEFNNEDLDVHTGFSNDKELLRAIGPGVTKEDIAHARLYCVPDTSPERIGDFIVGYGQDDRSCVYSMVKALIEADPRMTAIALGVDREEIGSTGLTGAQGRFFEHRYLALIGAAGWRSLTESYMDMIYERSKCISADVCIAANYRNLSLIEKDNCAKFGHGIGLIPHFGGGGKYQGNFASARFLNEIRQVMLKNKAVYQIAASPSKVDQGGGGTIAKFFAQRGIAVVDVGIPVGGMHSPEEVIHKADLYSAIKCFKAIYES